MSSRTRIDESIDGKRVIDDSGETVGLVTEVRGDTAYVDPDPGITDRVMARLGWDEAEESDYPLTEDQIERVTDDEVHLKGGR